MLFHFFFPLDMEVIVINIKPHYSRLLKMLRFDLLSYRTPTGRYSPSKALHICDQHDTVCLINDQGLEENVHYSYACTR